MSVTPYETGEGDGLITDKPTLPDLPSLATPPGDGNLDGSVDGLDFLRWAANFGSNVPAGSGEALGKGDFNNDGIVDASISWSGPVNSGPSL